MPRPASPPSLPARGLSSDHELLVQVLAIVATSNRPLTPSALARRLGVSQETLTPVIASLVSLGICTRTDRYVDAASAWTGRSSPRAASYLDMERALETITTRVTADAIEDGRQLP